MNINHSNNKRQRITTCWGNT